MNTAILQAADEFTAPRGRGLGLANLVQRLKRLRPRHVAKPDWSHVPDRVWRRHSAMLTFRYEAESGEG